MYRFLICFVLMMCGCQSQKYVRTEYGYGSQWLIAKAYNDFQPGLNWKGEPRSAAPVDGHYISVAVGIRDELLENIDLGLSVGPSIFIPTKGPEGEFVGAEAKPRITYTGWPIRPYIEGIIGVGHTRQLWPGEGSYFQFSVGGSVGAAVSLDKENHWELDFGVRFYHLSNGSAIFGSPKPNVGYNTDMVYLGLQHNF